MANQMDIALFLSAPYGDGETPAGDNGVDEAERRQLGVEHASAIPQWVASLKCIEAFRRRAMGWIV